MCRRLCASRSSFHGGIAVVIGFLALPLIAYSQAFTIAGWGDGSSGQLTIPSAATEVSSIAAGDGHALALRSDGRVIAWGRNDAGQTNVPAAVPGTMTPITYGAIAAGARHSFAYSSAGLISWGAVTAVPVYDGFGPLRALAAGNDFNLIADINGKVTAAGGNNAYGQLTIPAGAQSGVIALAAGDGHVLALKENGSVIAWGRNDFGQATVPAAAQNIFAIAAGRDFSVALRMDGMVVVWGRGATTVLKAPASANGASKVAAGADFIVVETDEKILAWGATGSSTTVPTAINRATTIAAGSRFALAVHAPYFTKLPGLVQIRPGETAELSASVSHTTGLTTYWDMTSRPSGLTLPFPNVSAASSGSYTVVAEYAAGYSMSATGVLVVIEPPRVRDEPAELGIVRENGSATFFFDVEGSGPFTFQWQKNGVAIPGATTRIWTLQPVTRSDAGRYSCLVSNLAGQVETPSREIQVESAKNGRELSPTFAETGARVALRADFGNQRPPFSNYIWTKADVVIPGATGSELVISNFSAADSGLYRVSFTDGRGQINFTTFPLDLYRPVGPPFHGYLNPSSALVKPGTSLTVKLEGVSSSPPVSYQWQVQQSGTNTLTRNEVNLTALPLDLSTAPDRVRVMVHAPDSVFPIFSYIDVRDGEPTPGQVIRQAGPDTLATGETGTFVAEVAGGENQMVWTKDGVVVAGQSSSTLTITNVTEADAGTYVARWTGPGGTTVSWELQIIEQTSLVSQPANTTLAGGSAQLTATLSASSPSGYKVLWLRDGAEFWFDARSGNSGSTLTTSLPGSYRARFYLDTGIVETATAVVSAAGAVGATPVPPGVYLDDRGAVYVRPNRTAMIAGTIDWDTVGWFGETAVDASGTLLLPRALRVVGDDEPMVLDDRLPFSGQISSEGELRAYASPIAGQTIRTSLSRDADRKREGFFRGSLPGTTGGEIWVFVTADDRASVYLHDGYAIYTATTINPSSLTFSADGTSVSYGSFPFGPFVAFRDGIDWSNGGGDDGGGGGGGDEPEDDDGDGVDGGAQLVNVSVRARAGFNDQTLIAGLVIGGSQPRQVLIRAIGPGLIDQGVSDALADPDLQLFRGSAVLANNKDWGENATQLSAAFTQLGAFPLKSGSKDAALLITLDPGVYTAHVIVPNGSAAGEALIETYDAGGNAASARLVNLSSRVEVKPGTVAIQGFVITGTQPKRMLIRAVGPGLASLGVRDSLRNPHLQVYRGSTPLLSNENWDDSGAASSVAAAGVKTGAFPLGSGGLDAAVVDDFEPGLYTVHVSGSSASEGGVVLVELYEVP